MGREYESDVLVMGSIPSLGRVMLFDDMEGLFKWAGSGSGSGYTIEKATDEAYNGLASLHIKTQPTIPVEDEYVIALRYGFPRPGKRYRLELLFKYMSESAVKYVQMGVYVHDGSLEHQIEFRFDVANRKWLYKSGSATYSDVPGGAQRLEQIGWHRFMVEWNEATKKLTRIVCDGLELDDLGLTYYSVGSSSGQALFPRLVVYNAGTAQSEAYCDDLLVMEI